MPVIKAELIPDGGLSSQSFDFFRSPAFLDAEGVTHTLSLDTGSIRATAPVIVRPIPGRLELCDASSPYGYPGFSCGRETFDVAQIEWPPNLVSLFIRDRLDHAPLSSAKGRSTVQVVDPSRPIQIRQDHRAQIARNERSGFTTTCLAGPETSATDRETFRRLYLETMHRVGALPRYRFTGAYVDLVLADRNATLCTIVAPDGQPASAGILVSSDGWLHYFLGGTAQGFLSDAPSKNLVMRMVSIAVARKLPLNLGGGLEPGDGLELFKKGFANTTVNFRTSDTITNVNLYARLCAGRPSGTFFPAYRTPTEG